MHIVGQLWFNPEPPCVAYCGDHRGSGRGKGNGAGGYGASAYGCGAGVLASASAGFCSQCLSFPLPQHVFIGAYMGMRVSRKPNKRK